MNPTTVVWIVMVVGLSAALLAIVLNMQQRRLAWTIPAGLASALILAVPFAGPQTSPPPKGAPLVNVSDKADFLTRWQQNAALLGDPIGEIYMRRGFLVAPCSYGWMEFHEDITDKQWRVMLVNAGRELMEQAGGKPDDNPVLPPALVLYVGSLKAQGVDTYWAFGNQLSNITIVDGQPLVYFEKAIFVVGSDDAASVSRLPVGSMLWAMEHGGINPLKPDVWTPLRRMLLFSWTGLIVLSSLPKFVPALRGEGVTGNYHL